MAQRMNKCLKAEHWPYFFLAVGFILLSVSAVLTEHQGLNFRPEILKGRIIVIDPGHGGVDGGAESALGDLEKEITLQIGNKVANRLKAAGEANVIMTREVDIDFYTRGKGGKRNDLERRLTIAQENNAELFVSIHANSIRGKQWTGAQTFYHSSSTEGKRLAEIIQSQLRDFPPGNKRREKAEDYYILRKSTVPTVLVEVGFLSSPDEAARLKNEAYQERLAEAIFRGIVEYAAQSTQAG